MQSSRDHYSEIRTHIEQVLLNELDLPLLQQPEQALAKIQSVCENAIKQHKPDLDGRERQGLINSIIEDFLGYGPLAHYLNLPSINSIMVNGHNEVFIEQSGRTRKAESLFVNEEHLTRTIERMTSFSQQSFSLGPTLSLLQLPKGFWASIISRPTAIHNAVLTIHSPPQSAKSLDAFGITSRQAANFLQQCVKEGKRIIVCGPVGSGKTTLLALLVGFIPDDMRIFVIGEESWNLPVVNLHLEYLSKKPAGEVQEDELSIYERLQIAQKIPYARVILPEEVYRLFWSPQVLDALSQTSFLAEVRGRSSYSTLLQLARHCLHTGRKWTIEQSFRKFAESLDLIINVNHSRSNGYHIVSIDALLPSDESNLSLFPLFTHQYDANDQKSHLVYSAKDKGDPYEFLENRLLRDKGGNEKT